MANVKRTGLLDLVNLKALTFTGIMATVLAAGGCQMPNTQGPAGPAGAPGTPGLAGSEGGGVQLAPQKFCAKFEYEAEDEAQKDKSKYRFSVIAVDNFFKEIGSKLGDEYADAEGCVTLRAPTNKLGLLTVEDTLSGDKIVVPVSGHSGSALAQTAASWLTPTHHAVWKHILRVVKSGGYKPASDWTMSDLAGINEKIGGDSDLDELFDAGTFLSSAGDLALAGHEAIGSFLKDNSGLLWPLANKGYAHVPLVVSNEFEANGTMADGDSIADDDDDGDIDGGDTESEVENSAEECELSEFFGAAIGLRYGFGGSTILNTDVDGDATANSGEGSDQTTCSKFDSSDDRLGNGVVGRSTITTGGQEGKIWWSAIALHFGSDPDNASHARGPAVYFDLAVEADDEPSDEVNLQSGSFIELDLAGAQAELVWSDGTNEVDAIEVNSETSAFIKSDCTSDDLLVDGTRKDCVFEIIKSCGTHEDLEFTYDAGSDLVTWSVTNDILVTKDDEAERTAHTGFVWATIDPADAAQVNTLLKIFGQNKASKRVDSFVTPRGNLSDADETLPFELAIMMAQGDGLCEPLLTDLGGDRDFHVGRKAPANIGFGGQTPFEDVTVSCASDEGRDLIGASTGTGIAFCSEVKAGDSITISSGEATETVTVVE